MPYDPTLYQGSAPYYARGRPPYSRQLVATLSAEVGLDGTGRLLDVGCGPGILTVELAPSFEAAIGLDPDADMLAEGARRAREAGVDNIRWVEAVAEATPTLAFDPCRLVTFGSSYQWTDQVAVGEAVYDLLEPGGTIALVVHTVEGRPQPDGPGYPPIPHDELKAIVRRYLGPRRRAGQGFTPDFDRYADALARTRFGRPRSVFAPGRPDVVRDVDGVLAGYLSTSYAAPHLFGDRLDAFEADVRALLNERSPDGLFWDWPGDTEILLARKPA
ncbi:MAG TPA: class I SAM-dependent methyltransferase [Acidimicrobiia bacterium]|nr:class I SAM-dependent methyltransferase [Acidimicrobiia bacterium]